MIGTVIIPSNLEIRLQLVEISQEREPASNVVNGAKLPARNTGCLK